jgi:hypothetical protein
MSEIGPYAITDESKQKVFDEVVTYLSEKAKK